MDSVVEQLRLGHEECERLENAIADALAYHPNKKRREEINRDHRCKQWLDRLLVQSSRLAAVYEDRDGALKREIMSIAGQGKAGGEKESGASLKSISTLNSSSSSSSDKFSEFYVRLQGIKNYHRKYPSEIPQQRALEEEFVSFRELNLTGTGGKGGGGATGGEAGESTGKVNNSNNNNENNSGLGAGEGVKDLEAGMDGGEIGGVGDGRVNKGIMVSEGVSVDFTDEEGYGKYIDLNEVFAVYLNMPKVFGDIDSSATTSASAVGGEVEVKKEEAVAKGKKRKKGGQEEEVAATKQNGPSDKPCKVAATSSSGGAKYDYLTYLSKFDEMFAEVPFAKKRAGEQYEKRYLGLLFDYLHSYVERVRPLLDVDEILRESEAKLKEDWTVKKVYPKGWEFVGELKTTGIFCEACNKNFTKQSVFDAHLGGKKHKRNAASLAAAPVVANGGKRKNQSKNKSNQTEEKKEGEVMSEDEKRALEIAITEGKILSLLELVEEQRSATIVNVERKQARTAEELENELADNEIVVESDEDDEEEKPIYNPKNLPLGWDGKPIPYWLYKLHGLNQDFTCEICGNETYRGPKAFRKHFKEWRHSHGMRCLNIPNTSHFQSITSIDQAKQLWEKLKNEKKTYQFVADVDEEYEDSQGNIVSKKVYNDLKRQGLL
eukprot:Nk52_evm22s628 gene=Nk52_evmTU22s628